MGNNGYQLLKVYTGENLRWKGVSLYHALVLKLRERGVLGVTVYRGIEGYGPEQKLRTSRILDLSVDLPVVLEVVDRSEKIAEILPLVTKMVQKGMVLIQEVEVVQIGGQPIS